MSAVTVKRILAVDPHPSADDLEFAVVESGRSIVRKGAFRKGDLAAHIPEMAVLPEWLLRRMGFWDTDKQSGTLSGDAGDRVKEIRLHGELSQGLCYPVSETVLVDPLDDTLTDRGFVLRVDKAAMGVSGFIVREGDEVAGRMGIK